MLARLGKGGRVAVVLGVVALVCLVWWLGTLVYAVFLPTPAATSAQAEEKQRLAELQEKFKKQIAQFDGRTVFYVPAAPDAKAAEEEAPVDSGGPPPPPSTYGGPSIIGMVNDTVWFSDGSRIKAGEGSGDIKVVKLNAPWDATINWKGAEFTVKFFERDGVVLAKSSSSSTTGSAIDPTYTPPPPKEKPAEGAAKPDPSKPDPAKPDAPKPDAPAPAPAGGSGAGDAPPPPPPEGGPERGPPPEGGPNGGGGGGSNSGGAASEGTSPAPPTPAPANPSQPQPVDPQPVEPQPIEPK